MVQRKEKRKVEQPGALRQEAERESILMPETTSEQGGEPAGTARGAEEVPPLFTDASGEAVISDAEMQRAASHREIEEE